MRGNDNDNSNNNNNNNIITAAFQHFSGRAVPVAAEPSPLSIPVSCPATHRQIPQLLLCTGYAASPAQDTNSVAAEVPYHAIQNSSVTSWEVSMITLMLGLGLQPYHASK